MKIYIAADHRGLALKNKIGDWLRIHGYDTTDLATDKQRNDDDYPDFAIKVAEAVAEQPSERRGILICGSGVGMAVTANKIPGIRAAFIHDPAIARAARSDDDINVLALGTDFVTEVQAKEVVEVWLTTDFSGEPRHVRRIEKIRQYENARRQ